MLARYRASVDGVGPTLKQQKSVSTLPPDIDLFDKSGDNR